MLTFKNAPNLLLFLNAPNLNVIIIIYFKCYYFSQDDYGAFKNDNDDDNI